MVGSMIAMAVIGAATATHGILSAQDAKVDAKRQENVQKRQIEMTNRVESYRKKRLARIRMASMQNTTGAAGIGGDTAQGAVTSINSSLEGGLDLLNSQTNLQIQQNKLQTESSINAANTQIGQSIGGLAQTAANVFSSGVFDKPGTTPDLSQPD